MSITFESPTLSDTARAAVAGASAAVREDLDRCLVSSGQADRGWMNPDEWASPEFLDYLVSEAGEVRATSDALVVVGVGGSNQAARAVVEALGPDVAGPEVFWAGTNLSADYHERLFTRLRGRKAHFVVIAKSFATLEPGMVFRLCRDFARREYPLEWARHFTLVGSRGSRLEELAREEGTRFLEFPENVGGRFTALTAVGTFPLAVAGVDVHSYVDGARSQLRAVLAGDTAASDYVAARHAWLDDGFTVEALSFFEPALQRVGAWWVQLIAESEGKERRGFFPVALSYSEQLHSVGQFVQDGPRLLAETFLDVRAPRVDLTVPQDGIADGFDYITGASLNEINRKAFGATLRAHADDGVPTGVITVPAVTAHTLGELFYFFEYAVAISGRALRINPFDQPGVEAYKELMFAALGRN